jgi:hypothetical protein
MTKNGVFRLFTSSSIIQSSIENRQFADGYLIKLSFALSQVLEDP